MPPQPTAQPRVEFDDSDKMYLEECGFDWLPSKKAFARPNLPYAIYFQGSPGEYWYNLYIFNGNYVRGESLPYDTKKMKLSKFHKLSNLVEMVDFMSNYEISFPSS